MSGAALDPLARLRLALRVAGLSNDCAAEELTPLIHPELHVPSVPGVAPADGFRGIDGFHRYFREAREHGFLAQAALTQARVTDVGTVFATGDLVCTIGGVVERFPAWFVYRFRDGLVSAIETYTDRDLAWARAQEG